MSISAHNANVIFTLFVSLLSEPPLPINKQTMYVCVWMLLGRRGYTALETHKHTTQPRADIRTPVRATHGYCSQCTLKLRHRIWSWGSRALYQQLTAVSGKLPPSPPIGKSLLWTPFPLYLGTVIKAHLCWELCTCENCPLKFTTWSYHRVRDTKTEKPMYSDHWPLE